MSRRLSEVVKLFLLAMIFLVIGRDLAHAQTNAEINAGIQLNFATPGARSLALGGAFLGLADDATAAFANPAGLTILSKPEISVEGRRWSYSPTFTDRGHAFGDPSPNPPGTVDTVSGLVSKSAKDDVTGLSFLSFVYPGKRWAVAIYRQELANFKGTFRTNGAFISDPDPTIIHRLNPVDASLDLSIVNLGVSGAYRISDNLSIGVGVFSSDFTLTSNSTRYRFLNNGTSVGGFFGPPNYDPTKVKNMQDQHGSERDIAFNVGTLWKINSKWSAGAVYRKGPKFSLTTTNEVFDVGATEPRLVAGNKGTFHVPDVFGAGIAFRPVDTWTITADYDRVRYSQLTKGSVDVFFDPSDTSTEAANERLAASRLVADDANEFHLGVEYVWALKHPVAFRAGGWLDPDHKVHFGGVATTNEDKATAVRFQRGKNEAHYSAGFGVVFSDRFQIDAAADFSDLIKTASLSGVFRF